MNDYGYTLYTLVRRQLQQTSEKVSYVEASLLVNALRRNAEEPVPPDILDYVCEALEGKVKAPGGRPRKVEARHVIARFWLVMDYQRYYAWLHARKTTHGLRGWQKIRDADWWQGPPSERAARMAARRYFEPIDWRHVVNIASRYRRTGSFLSSAFSHKKPSGLL